MPLSFYVHGTPVGQPRPRACIRGRHAGMYDPGTADAWKAAVAAAAKAAWDGRVFDCPIRLLLTIWMPRPKSHLRSNGEVKPTAPRWPTAKPYRDNLEKAVLDAITTAGVWKDDSLVCSGNTTKTYGVGRAGAHIRIEEIVE
jgi:crossover junction endodeoxyribonuclease RusA